MNKGTILNIEMSISDVFNTLILNCEFLSFRFKTFCHHLVLQLEVSPLRDISGDCS